MFSALHKHDVAFLVCVRPAYPIGTHYSHQQPFVPQVGLVYVRGCEIEGMLDANGRVIEEGQTGSTIHAHIRTHTRTHAQTHTHTHAHTRTDTHAHTHTRTRTYTHTHAHTHTPHAHTHTHTHTCCNTDMHFRVLLILPIKSHVLTWHSAFKGHIKQEV